MSAVKLPHLIYEKKGQVLEIRMDWISGKNAMDWQSMDSLAQVYRMAEEEKELKIVVLRGSGGYFNTGGCVNTKDEEDKRRYREALERLTEAQKYLELPVLAAVNGDCLAGGMMFLADADFAVSLTTARYAFPEILHGAFPIMVMLPLVDVIPRKRALEVFCSGEEFSAEEALEMGLLNRVVSEEEFEAAIQYYIDMICKIDKEVLRIGRTCYYKMLSLPKEERHECGMRALREVWEAKEAGMR